MAQATRRPTVNFIPMAEIAVAVVLVFALLPSALRPPNENPPGTPQLSPDAPPDDDQQAIIAALNRGLSGTGGAGVGAGIPDLDDLVAPVRRPPRACPGGFGNPPRQVESVYAPPCAPAFVGNNGGATARGVTGDEIRIAVAINGKDRRVTPEPAPDENVSERALRAYMNYFNSRFQFYGRRLVFYQFKFSGEDAVGIYAGGQDDTAREFAANMDTVAPFGAIIIGAGPTVYDELSRRKIVHYGGTNYSNHWLEDRAPYSWSFYIDGQQLGDLGAEYFCKKLVGKPAVFAGDEQDTTKMQRFEKTTRKFGYLRIYTSHFPTHPKDESFQRKLKRMCGAEVVYGEYDRLSPDQGQRAIQTAIAEFKKKGVTTVFMSGDHVSVAAGTRYATAAIYFPEWVTLGQAFTDSNEYARRFDPQQWQHAFGITANEFARPFQETDYWKAFKEMDKGADPTGDFNKFSIAHFPSLMQLARGIQAAGPNLTAESFRTGQASVPKRPPDPFWSIAGGYGPGDPTCSEDVVDLWWDPRGDDPYQTSDASKLPGAYKFTRGGRRYREGTMDSDISSLFEEGATRAPIG